MGQLDGRVAVITASTRSIGRGIAEEERKKEVALLVRRYNDLIKKGDYNTAERVALQAKQLDADDPAVSALYEAAKLGRQVKEAEQRKAEHDKFAKLVKAAGIQVE